MKKIILFLFLPFISISQQLINENILFDGNNRDILHMFHNFSSSISTPILFAFHGGSGYANDS